MARYASAPTGSSAERVSRSPSIRTTETISPTMSESSPKAELRWLLAKRTPAFSCCSDPRRSSPATARSTGSSTQSRELPRQPEFDGQVPPDRWAERRRHLSITGSSGRSSSTFGREKSHATSSGVISSRTEPRSGGRTPGAAQRSNLYTFVSRALKPMRWYIRFAASRDGRDVRSTVLQPRLLAT